MRKVVLYALGLVVATLVALGLVVLFSASEVKASMLHHDSLYFLKRQGIYILAGLFVAFSLALFDYRKWRDYWGLTAFFAGVVFVLLLLVFFWDPIKGSRRWIPLGPVNFQPGEFAKIATVFIVSVWLDKVAPKVETFVKGALYPAGLIALMAVPVMLEPDFGSVMVIGLVGGMLMFVAGTKVLHLMPFILGGGAVFAWKVWETPNRVARILAFTGITLEGSENVADSAAYQSDMSLVAIYRGGMFGRGLLGSMQKQNYLPEAWTDFILAVGAEEMGLVFSVAVILLFMCFLFCAVHIARNAADRFGQMIVLGMTFIVFYQAMFNIGVVCGALPTKGMALPFFSYGGTHTLSAFFAVGMIFSVGIHTILEKKRAFLRKIVR